MNVCLLVFNEKTPRGRVYSAESFNTPIPEVVWVCFDSPDICDVATITGQIINIRMEDNKILLDL